MQRLHAIHLAYDERKLDAMKAVRLKRLPPVRVVDCGDHYMAIEGSHRLSAAADLCIAPTLIVLAEDDLVDHRQPESHTDAGRCQPTTGITVCLTGPVDHQI